MIPGKDINTSKRQFSEIEIPNGKSSKNKRLCHRKKGILPFPVLEEGEIEQKIQKISKIVFINEYKEIAKNLIWMNDQEIEHLFSDMPSPSDQTGKFVQLSNRVYEVASNPLLPNNSIGLSHLQYKDVKAQGGIFLDNNIESILINPFPFQPKKVNKLQNVILEIAINQDLESPNEFPKVFCLEQLQKEFNEYFKKKFISINQTLLVDHYMGQFKVIVKEMYSHPDIMKMAFESKQGKCPFGFIDTDTVIGFQVEESSEIIIIDRILSGAETKFNFTLTLLDNLEKTEDSNYALLPIVLNTDILKNQVQSLLKNSILYHGMTLPIVYNNFWNIELELTKIDTLYPFETVEFYPHNHQVGYKCDEEFDLDFLKPDGNILLVRGDPIPAEVVSLEVIHAAETPYTAHSSKKLLWVSVDELKEKIGEIYDGFARSQFLNLSLASGYVVVKVKDTWTSATDTRTKSLRGKRLWTADPDTVLKFSFLPGVKTTMVNNKKSYRISQLKIKIPSTATKNLLNQKALEKAVREKSPDFLVKDQKFKVKVKGHSKMFLTVSDITFGSKVKIQGDFQTLGTIGPNTKIKFETENNDTFIFEEEVCLASKDPTVKLEQMGLGGLSKECKEVLADLVSSRGRLKDLVEDYGIKPIKGLLFYGPPGTGKTTLAKFLGQILGVSKKNIQILSAPEVLIKWVGDSEKKVRELFKPAEEAALKNKEELYIIVMDEIDAITPPRGSDNAGKNSSSIVGQLLAKLDGLLQLSNLLFIGTTNRKDQIDSALLRPGRLVPLEIGVPNAEGRRAILEIHTRRLQEKKRLEKDFDFDRIVNITEGYVGADIQGIVAKAASKAHRRLNQLDGTIKELMQHPDGIVTMKDFEEALKELNKGKDKGLEAISHIYL